MSFGNTKGIHKKFKVSIWVLSNLLYQMKWPYSLDDTLLLLCKNHNSRHISSKLLKMKVKVKVKMLGRTIFLMHIKSMVGLDQGSSLMLGKRREIIYH